VPIYFVGIRVGETLGGLLTQDSRQQLEHTVTALQNLESISGLLPKNVYTGRSNKTTATYVAALLGEDYRVETDNLFDSPHPISRALQLLDTTPVVVGVCDITDLEKYLTGLTETVPLKPGECCVISYPANMGETLSVNFPSRTV